MVIVFSFNGILLVLVPASLFTTNKFPDILDNELILTILSGSKTLKTFFIFKFICWIIVPLNIVDFENGIYDKNQPLTNN